MAIFLSVRNFVDGWFLRRNHPHKISYRLAFYVATGDRIKIGLIG